MSKHIGVFGGTFDPPHVGHVVTALNVRHELDLDEVHFVVANEPWQKVGDRDITASEIRFSLVQAAVSPIEGLIANRIEIERGGPSYTADTLKELKATRPDDQLFLILGFDAAAAILSWERVDEISDLAKLVVVDRPGHSGDQLPEGFEWTRVEVPRLEVSSTDLRRRVLSSQPLQYLLPDEVIAEIGRHQLYGAGSISDSGKSP